MCTIFALLRRKGHNCAVESYKINLCSGIDETAFLRCSFVKSSNRPIVN